MLLFLPSSFKTRPQLLQLFGRMLKLYFAVNILWTTKLVSGLYVPSSKVWTPLEATAELYICKYYVVGEDEKWDVCGLIFLSPGLTLHFEQEDNVLYIFPSFSEHLQAIVS